jgi:hypothetical protein
MPPSPILLYGVPSGVKAARETGDQTYNDAFKKVHKTLIPTKVKRGFILEMHNLLLLESRW